MFVGRKESCETVPSLLAKVLVCLDKKEVPLAADPEMQVFELLAMLEKNSLPCSSFFDFYLSTEKTSVKPNTKLSELDPTTETPLRIEVVLKSFLALEVSCDGETRHFSSQPNVVVTAFLQTNFPAVKNGVLVYQNYLFKEESIAPETLLCNLLDNKLFLMSRIQKILVDLSQELFDGCETAAPYSAAVNKISSNGLIRAVLVEVGPVIVSEVTRVSNVGFGIAGSREHLLFAVDDIVRIKPQQQKPEVTVFFLHPATRKVDNITFSMQTLVETRKLVGKLFAMKLLRDKNNESRFVQSALRFVESL